MPESSAPICFGAITYYTSDADRCRLCMSFDACTVRVGENIKEVSRVLDLEGILERHRSARRLAPTRAKASPSNDAGKLKTQAPAVERNVVQGSISLREQAKIELKMEMRSIIASITGGMSVDELRDSLAAGENPFPQAMTEQWVLCELLRRGASTKALIEGAVTRLGGSDKRKSAVVPALTAIGLIDQDGDTVRLKETA